MFGIQKFQGWWKLFDAVPSGRLIMSSKHRGSSCKTAVEHHQQHMVPNLFQTIHRYRSNIPSFKIIVWAVAVCDQIVCICLSFFWYSNKIISKITKSSLIRYIAGSSASPTLWCLTFNAYRSKHDSLWWAIKQLKTYKQNECLKMIRSSLIHLMN